MSRDPTILFAVGDASGDPYAAELTGALRARYGGARFLGMGGPEMEKAGVELVVHQHEVAIGGLIELAGSLSRIVSAWRKLGRALDGANPDLAILIDTADFNIPFARRLQRAGVPVLYYIPPQVWAWRRARIRKLARRANRLAVIFPFELEVYREEGVPVDFVGHPLLEPTLAHRECADRDSLRRELVPGEAGQAPVVALLPGSRRNELAYQLPLQLEVASALHARDPSVRFVVAVAPSLRADEVQGLAARCGLPADLALHIVEGRTYDVLCASDAALVKPGTGTLEAALLGCPLVVAGRGHPLSAAILRRLVDVPAWAMPNLIAGETIIPEFLQEHAKPAAIADALQQLLHGDARAAQLEALRGVRERLGAGSAADSGAAAAGASAAVTAGWSGATVRVAAIVETMLGTVGT